MSIVYSPRVHRCDDIGGELPNAPAWHVGSLADSQPYECGTVRQCRCGQTWVAGRMPGYMRSIWRREGRIERWLRQRRRS